MADCVYNQAQRALRLLHLIHLAGGDISSAELAQEIGTSRATANRLIRSLRDDFGMTITYHHEIKTGLPGRYTIDDWGILDRTRFLRRASRV